jgi:hypothetical protein
MQLLPDYVRLRKAESFHRLGDSDVFELGVVSYEFVPDTPTGSDNKARSPDKCVQEALELHPNDYQTQRSVG